MLYRIPMNIVDVPGPVVVVPDPVFPETSLPDAARALRHQPALARETRLDHLPSGRVIRISVRQRPEGMEVVRQDDHGINVERPLRPHSPKDFSQEIDLL